MGKSISSAPGEDFLVSLQDLFDEAGERGREFQPNFNILKEPLIQYVRNCGRMTSAKARASLDLSFTDRRRPETIVQLPPSTIKVDDEAAERLRSTASRNEFIGVMRTLVDESIPVKKRKRPPTKAQRLKMDEVKKPKGVVRLINVPPLSQVDVAAMKEQSAWQSLKSQVLPSFKNRSIPPQFSEPEDQPIQSIERTPEPDFISSSQTAMSSTERERLEREETMYTANTTVMTDVEDIASEEPEKLVGGREVMGSPELGHVVVRRMPVDEDVDMTGVSQAATEPILEDTAMNSYMDHDVSDLELLGPQIKSEDGEFPSLTQPCEDLEKTTEENNDGAPDESTEEVTEDPRQVLAGAISRIQAEIADIPVERWQKYHTKLINLCDTYDMFTLPFKDRLNKITRIIYLAEEEEAVIAGDWSRLPSVVRICAFLAQTTGPAPEEPDQKVVNGWVIGRLRDVKFLEAKKRIFQLTAESEIA